MIFLYEYIPTVLTIPTAYCMETEFWELKEFRLGLAWLGFVLRKLSATLDKAIIM
jgi:hypothetical protein